MNHPFRKGLLSAALLMTTTSGVQAAVIVAPGHALRRIPTPGTVQGGVVRSGNALLVGQGTFGPGNQSIVRLEGATAVTVAEGFGSLGGFDLDASGGLLAVDNCFTADFSCGAAVTGDTLYRLPDSLTRSSFATAASIAVLPNGSISAAQDVLALAGGDVLVSDSVGPGAGRVLQVSGTSVSTLIPGLDFAAGIAADGANLLVGNSNFPAPGAVGRYTAAGAPLGTAASGLNGVYGVAKDGAGNVLVTGGSAVDFSATVIAVDGAGVASEVARGFSFTTDVFYDAARDAALVLDFGATEVAALCRDVNADAVCDADCSAPEPFQRLALKVSGVGTPAGDDGMRLTGTFFAAAAPAIDPVSGGFHVWADDAAGQVVVDVVLPSGAFDPVSRIGWKVNGSGTSFKFKHPTGVVGITSATVRVKPGAPAEVKFKAVGKRAGYASAGATFPMRVGAAVSPTQCAAAPVPCVLGGTKLTCK